MKIIIKIVKQIFLLPYTALNTLILVFDKNRASTQISGDAREKNSNLKYFLSLVFWIFIGYLIFKPYIGSNRIVYACPLNYSLPCDSVEAEYKSYCDKSGNCFRDYENITLSNKKIIKFSYCDQKAIAVHTCYSEGDGEAWRLEYRGRNVFK